MAEAVALAGGRVIQRFQVDEPLAIDAATVVVVDLAGMGALPPDLLSDLAARADVIACDLDQLDHVAAELSWTDAQLLCDATPAERIEALVLAAAQAETPEPTLREGESDRLRRFGGEVGRIARLLAQIAGEAGAGQGHGEFADVRPSFQAQPPDHAVAPATVRQAIRARRLRASFFGEGLFEDPAWDMLLDLFAAELEGGRVSVSSLCIAAHVAPTTALRWIGRLADAGLFERRPDPHDRRRAFIALSAHGSAAMSGYLAALARTGMALG